MSEFTKLMLEYSEGELEMKEVFQIEHMIAENEDLKNEYILNQCIDEYMRLQLIMQDIHADPELTNIELTAKEEVDKYIKGEKDQDIAQFINTSIKRSKELELIIDAAEREMHLSGIDRQVNEWVQQFVNESSQFDQPDNYTKEILDFVRLGMNEGSKTEIRLINDITKNRKRFLVYLSSAAAILILAFGIWGVINPETNPNELFDEYYQPVKLVDRQTRSTAQKFNSKYDDAIELYQKGNYSKAGQLFNELLIVDSKSTKIQLLYGISQLEEKQYDVAIVNFKEIIHRNGEYLIEAKWYLAMTYLKKGDVKPAELLLKELAQTPGYYKDKSEKILEKL